jgi:hypothetical protein
MFRPFLNWPSSGWIQCQRNYIPTVNMIICVTVSTKRGGRDLVYKKQGMCADWWWKLDTCINHVGIVCPLLVSCVGLRGLGLVALVAGGGRVSQWSAVVAISSPPFCTHSDTNDHVYSRYIVPLTLYPTS